MLHEVKTFYISFYFFWEISFSKCNFLKKILFRDKSKKIRSQNQDRLDETDSSPTFSLDPLLKNSLFYSIPGPRHIDAAEDLGVRNIVTRRVATSHEISLPLSYLFL